MVQRVTGLRRRSVLAGLTGAALFPRPLLAQGMGMPRVIGILIGQGTAHRGNAR